VVGFLAAGFLAAVAHLLAAVAHFLAAVAHLLHSFLITIFLYQYFFI